MGTSLLHFPFVFAYTRFRSKILSNRFVHNLPRVYHLSNVLREIIQRCGKANTGLLKMLSFKNVFILDTHSSFPDGEQIGPEDLSFNADETSGR